VSAAAGAAGSGLRALARPSGTFLMVAADQRDSLRTMLAERGRPHATADLVRFKLAVATELGRYASGLLIDARHGYREVVERRLLPPTCGLILAADALVQEPGEPVRDTDLDETVDPSGARADGVAALKLLVVWRRDADRSRRLATAERFVRRCREAGLLSVLEAVVRPAADRTADWDREADLLDAAAALGGLGPSLYKAEVPCYGRSAPAELVERCRRLDAVLPCPWVVLSQGVDPADFPAAVAAACRGGASGILAGRAVWTSALDADDPAAALRTVAAPRLARLAEVVDTLGRPWWGKGPRPSSGDGGEAG
jgi:sulfofructosephosphate aldolase